MRRTFLLAAALAIPLSGASFVLGTGQAGAAVKIVCTTMSGNGASQIVISGCSGGNTGGASLPFTGSALASGGTIHWTSGSSTTIGAAKLTAISAKKCPGYVAGGTNNPMADKLTAPVAGDVGDGIQVPGVAKGAVCIATNLNVSALKPLKIS
jgi:hypothetical protein